jgi:hypothetical protein
MNFGELTVACNDVGQVIFIAIGDLNLK